MRRLKHIFLAAVLSTGLTQLAWGQLESLSDAQIPCDKVFAVDGDVAVGADNEVHYGPLKTFDLNSGKVLSTIDGSFRSFVEVGGESYFFTVGQDLLHFQNGVLQLVEYDEDITGIFSLSEMDLLFGRTPQGLILVSNGEVIQALNFGASLIHLIPYEEGFLGISSASYFKLDGELSILESNAFPEGLKSFHGAVNNGVILLTGELNEQNQRPMSLLDIESSDVYPVVDSSGAKALPFGFALPKKISGDMFFIAGNGQASFEATTFTFPTEAGLIDIETGIYTPANFRPGLWQDVVQPFTQESLHGTVVFGRMGMEGVEPYIIVDNQVEPIMDVYPGWGGSLDLLVQSTNLGPTAGQPVLFHLTEKEGIIYFTARSPHFGLQVWRTDGSAEGTYAITSVEIADKGFQKCFFSQSDGQILLTALYRNGERRLYRIDENAGAVFPEIDKERNWEVNYSKNPEISGSVTYLEANHPEVHLAQDGSSLLVLNRTDIWFAQISYNHKWVMPPNRIYGFYARTFIQTINSDGSLRASAVIRAREDQQRNIGRSYINGRTYALVSHRPEDTWVNGRQLMETTEGHYLIELDDRGAEIKSTFLPTGGKDHFEIAQVEVGSDGIYVLGMADRNFTTDGAYTNTIEQNFVRAVLMKFDLNHNLLWIADSGLDQDIFGSGLQSLVIGEEEVYMASGGTSYNVRSSCAFSEWPYQISSFDAESGERQWRRLLEASDVTRITDMVLVGEQWLWLGGSTRGDLSIGEKRLNKVVNYLDCSYNAFLLCIDAQNNQVAYFNHSDPERAKFPQDLAVHEEHVYVLSAIYEETSFPLPIYGYNGRWNLQIDKLTNGGVMVDSLIWPTQTGSSSLTDRLWRNKFGFDFHPQGGVLIGATQFLNGGIDGFYSPASSPELNNTFNTWTLQRRDIEDLVSVTLPEPSVSTGDFEIYPNPVFSDAFVLELPSEDVGKYDQLIMTDINGRIVSSQNLSGPFGSRLISVDGSLSNGTYLIQLVGSSKSEVKKLMLQR